MRGAVINQTTNLVENVVLTDGTWVAPTGYRVVLNEVAQIGDSFQGDALVPADRSGPASPAIIDLSTLQARIEAEGAWDTYVNYMFGAAPRRNAFLKTMMIGHPVPRNYDALQTTLLGAGLTQAQVDRILS